MKDVRSINAYQCYRPPFITLVTAATHLERLICFDERTNARKLDYQDCLDIAECRSLT
jgi:hypothetical protein